VAWITSSCSAAAAVDGVPLTRADRVARSCFVNKRPVFLPTRSFYSCAILAVVMALRLTAQDVTVTPATWIDPADAPEELPKLKNPPRIEFPAELKATPDIGYVVFDLVLDPKGRVLSLGPHATLSAYSRVSNQQHEGRWEPGKRAGKGVNTAVNFAIIFNPASAAENTPDATPRLLEVAVAKMPRPKNAKPADIYRNEVVPAELKLDEKGAIVAIQKIPPKLTEAIKVAAKNWRFAPARRNGQPVPADVTVNFIVDTDNGEALTGETVVPRPIFRIDPVYPLSMRASGMKGEVVVDFVVDIEGRVRNAFVIRSLNPTFDDPAVEAVRQWRFEPGRRGGRPVNTHMQVPIIFNLQDTYRSGRGPIQEPSSKPDLSKLPEEFRYETAPRPIGTARPVYPYALLRDKKKGKATVRFVVGQKGRVEQVLIDQASSPEFGRALAAAIEQFVYEPALKGGRPCLALQGFLQEFDTYAPEQLVSPEDLELLRRELKKPESIVTLAELDAKPVPRSRRPPVFPVTAPKGTTQGEAFIEFIIDEEGWARLPRIVSASDESFGYAAVQSIATWRFEPPKRGGKSVAVRVHLPVKFGEQPKAPDEK
jgi:TonB family protein